MPQTIEIGSLIESSPEVRGGRPRIAGTGVTVGRIVNWYKQGLTPNQIVSEIPHLTLAQVFAALTYYHANRQEIETDLAQEQAEAERIEREHYSPGPK
jgi:uncharacterized protein (DUF433 family)